MSTQPGDQRQSQQQQQPQYVQVPEALHNQQQQQQQATALTSVTAPASSSNYPAFDLGKFWTEQMHLADMFESDFKNHPLPLARIKKVMKTDQEVKVFYCLAFTLLTL
ncbi:unnamed protein product [Mucor hiemalis]